MKYGLWLALLVLAPLLTACPQTPPPAYTYTFILSPNSGSVALGSTTTTTATITPQHNFTGSVSFRLVSPPAGITLTGGPASVTGTASLTASMTIAVASGVTPGDHPLTVAAESASLQRTATFTLTVVPSTPAVNPAIRTPGEYIGGQAVLQQTATTAYFVSVHPVEATAAGTYNLEAHGTAAATLREHAPEGTELGLLGDSWRILEEGNRAGYLMPIPPQPWAVPDVQPLAVGAQRQFWVCVRTPCRWADGGQAQITATLQAIGPRSLIYVDNRDLAAVPVSRAEGFRNVFDGQIWPRVTAVLGRPINPYNPAPGDGPTIILLSRTVREFGWGGYFHAIHLFPDSTAQEWGFRSNEASMFFVAHNMSDTFTHGVNADELAHLINFSQKRFVHGATAPESFWIDQGLSVIAQDIAGFGHQAGNVQWLARAFFEHADRVSLHNWGADAPIAAYYGAAWLFFRYIADRFGYAALSNLVQSPFVGVANLERVTGEPIGRTLVYSGIAMIVSTEGLNVTDPRWTYRSLSLASIGRISFGTAGAKTVGSVGFNFVAVSSGGQPVIRATVTAGTATPYVGLVR